MKLLVGIISTAVCAYILQLFGPWWIVAVGAFVVAVILNQKNWASFLTGFFGVALLWMLQALMKDMANDGILSAQVGSLLQGLSGAVLIIITALIGGIVGGLAGLLGHSAKELIS